MVAKSVARGRVDVIYIVLGSWIDVSMRVSVSCGRVDTIVLYCVDTIVAPGSDVVKLMISVMVLASRIEVSVK